METLMIAQSKLLDIDGLWRNETVSKAALGAHAMELTHAVYPHNQLYGQYCPIQEYIKCPPSDLFNLVIVGIGIAVGSFIATTVVGSSPTVRNPQSISRTLYCLAVCA